MAVSITVDIQGAQQGLSKLRARLDKEVLGALDEAAALVSNDAKADHPKVADNIQGAAADDRRALNPSGAGAYAGTYRFLTRTGVLRNSIQVVPARQTAQGYEAHVVSGVEYSNKVEFGSVSTRPFPFLRAAIETQRGATLERVRAAVQRGISG